MRERKTGAGQIRGTRGALEVALAKAQTGRRNARGTPYRGHKLVYQEADACCRRESDWLKLLCRTSWTHEVPLAEARFERSRRRLSTSSEFGSRGSEIANPIGPGAGCTDVECGPSPTSKFTPIERAAKRRAGVSEPNRSRLRVLFDGQALRVARCDPIWRSRFHPLFDGPHPPRGGTVPHATFHGHQRGVCVRNATDGFCGCRVGEASNPGLGRRRRRVHRARRVTKMVRDSC